MSNTKNPTPFPLISLTAIIDHDWQPEKIIYGHNRVSFNPKCMNWNEAKLITNFQ